MVYLYFNSVSLEPLATPLPVIVLALKRSTRSFSLPIRLLEPLRPEATIFPVDYGVEFEYLRVDDNVMLAQVVVTEDVAPLLNIGLRPPATVVLPEPAMDPVGSTEQCLARHARGPLP